MENKYGEALTTWLGAPVGGRAVMMPFGVSNVKYIPEEAMILWFPGVTDMLNIEEMCSRKC